MAKTKICTFYGAGKCTRNDCSFAHINGSEKVCLTSCNDKHCNKIHIKDICKHFNENNLKSCKFGNNCNFFHVTNEAALLATSHALELINKKNDSIDENDVDYNDDLYYRHTPKTCNYSMDKIDNSIDYDDVDYNDDLYYRHTPITCNYSMDEIDDAKCDNYLDYDNDCQDDENHNGDAKIKEYLKGKKDKALDDLFEEYNI